jgi:DNA-3-methyladenine glycosylase
VASSLPETPPRLGRPFFDRPTVRVAQELLGRTLHVQGPDSNRSVRLVEVEGYVANDPASHTFRGPTARNRSMFSTPGTLYVYRIHQVVCANLVTRAGEAVLLRAGAPSDGGEGNPSGPGRLCRYLGITLADDGVDTTEGPRAFVTPRPQRDPHVRIRTSPRVGISRAQERLLRFSLDGDPWVSRPRPVGALTSASPTRSRAVGGSPRTRRKRTPLSDGGTSGGRIGGR